MPLAETRALTAEAFRQAVREQLLQYLRLLAVLEEDLLRRVHICTKAR